MYLFLLESGTELPMKDLISQLKAMCFEAPETIIHGLDLLHFYFHSEDYTFAISNKVIMLGDQLNTVDMSMEEKIKILNSVFFEKENLEISRDDDAPIYLKHLFDKHIGNANLVSLVYQYFLRKLNISFKVWSLQQTHLIKVFNADKTYVINLMENGVRAKGKDLAEPSEEAPVTLQLQIYILLSKIADQHLMKSNFKKTIEVYNLILEIFPDKVFWFARRGLLNKNLGHFQEALKDLEKYSNYVAEKDFSNSIIQALIELKGLKYASNNQALTH